MGSVGDHWNDHKADVEFHELHGRWPGQKICKICGKVFWPPEWAKHTKVCRVCHKAKKRGNS